MLPSTRMPPLNYAIESTPQSGYRSTWTFTIWPGPALMTTGRVHPILDTCQLMRETMLFNLEYKTCAIQHVSICGDSFVLYDSRPRCLFRSVIIINSFELPDGRSNKFGTPLYAYVVCLVLFAFRCTAHRF